MKFGVLMFPTDYAIDPVTLGKAVEERGFESLFLPEHTHIPASRKTPWPGGSDLPKEYWHTHDPFVALGAIAAATKTLKIGTGICLVMQRDPIITAKEVASVDAISNGRFLFGIGGGWNREEMENHGTDPRKRFPILRERILAMKEIWTKDEPEYHGKYVDFDPIWSWPKPVQKPHPPILVGGGGPGTIDRVVEYGDGWLPIPGRGGGKLEEMIAELNSKAEAAGRGKIPVSIYGVPPLPEQVNHYIEMGIDRALFWMSPLPEDEALRYLDRCVEVQREAETAGA